MSLTDIRVANKSLPIARYVYLVQDASDSIRMGGVPGNTYTTFQAAYDAANTLQLALGGTNRVVIMVGNTTAAAVGGKYIIYVTNATGTDTLAITGSAIEGGAYVPTAVAGAVDMLEITYEAPVYNLFFVRPFMNFS
jgi:hypothetical protein